MHVRMYLLRCLPPAPPVPPPTHKQDFPQIAQHFRMVRTFYAVYYGVEVMPYIAKAGLRAALGVSIGRGVCVYVCR